MTDIDARASQASAAFGRTMRLRRAELAMTQNDLSLATGVGRRFIAEMERGKSTSELGRCLVVAKALGFGMDALLGAGTVHEARDAPQSLPDVEEEEEDGPVAHRLL